jgi:hypothetical protein
MNNHFIFNFFPLLILIVMASQSSIVTYFIYLGSLKTLMICTSFHTTVCPIFFSLVWLCVYVCMSV